MYNANNRLEELWYQIKDTRWNLASNCGAKESVGRYVRRDAPQYGLYDGEYLAEVLLYDDRVEVHIWHHPQREHWMAAEIERPVDCDDVVEAMDDAWDAHAETYSVAAE